MKHLSTFLRRLDHQHLLRDPCSRRHLTTPPRLPFARLQASHVEHFLSILPKPKHSVLSTLVIENDQALGDWIAVKNEELNSWNQDWMGKFKGQSRWSHLQLWNYATMKYCNITT
jgi:hypothetical protein